MLMEESAERSARKGVEKKQLQKCPWEAFGEAMKKDVWVAPKMFWQVRPCTNPAKHVQRNADLYWGDC